jgi:hypothetical protein
MTATVMPSTRIAMPATANTVAPGTAHATAAAGILGTGAATMHARTALRIFASFATRVDQQQLFTRHTKVSFCNARHFGVR